MEKIDKYSIMEILKERGCSSFDEDNYHLMDVSLVFTMFNETMCKSLSVDFQGGFVEGIAWKEYVKKSRESRINRLLDDI